MNLRLDIRVDVMKEEVQRYLHRTFEAVQQGRFESARKDLEKAMGLIMTLESNARALARVKDEVPLYTLEEHKRYITPAIEWKRTEVRQEALPAVFGPDEGKEKE